MFLRFFCPNRLVEPVPTFECRGGRIGGPSIETLQAHDFDKSPFVDIRYCQKCKVYIRFTIFNLNTPPKAEVLSAEEYHKIPYKTVDNMFGGIMVEGRICRTFSEGDKHE